MKHLICMACVVVLAGFTSGCIMGQAPIWAPISLDLMGSGPVGSGAMSNFAFHTTRQNNQAF